MTGANWTRMATWLIRALLVAILAMVVASVTILTILPRATHAQAMTVLTGSMTPGIPVGSVVLVRPTDPGTLQLGDVATYQREPGKAEFVTHRIVKIDLSTTPTSFVFKGDANRGPDAEPVPATAIRGKVWFHVPYLGALRDMLHTKGGAAGVLMLLAAAYALTQLTAAWRDRRTGSSAPIAAPPPAFQPESEVAEPRITMIAILRTEMFEGLSPRVVAQLFRGVVVDEEDAVFTLVVAEPEFRTGETLQLLRAFEPLSLECVPSAAPPPTAQAPLVDLTERALVVSHG
jgi:signal peptidase I